MFALKLSDKRDRSDSMIMSPLYILFQNLQVQVGSKEVWRSRIDFHHQRKRHCRWSQSLLLGVHGTGKAGDHRYYRPRSPSAALVIRSSLGCICIILFALFWKTLWYKRLLEKENFPFFCFDVAISGYNRGRIHVLGMRLLSLLCICLPLFQSFHPLLFVY